MTFLQVIFRYILLIPLTWSEEFTRFSFIWCVYLAAALGVERHAHFAIDVFIKLFPEKVSLGIKIFINALIAIFLIIVVINGVYIVSITSLQVSPAMRIPMSYVYLSLPFGCILMLVFILRDIYNTGRLIKQKEEK